MVKDWSQWNQWPKRQPREAGGKGKSKGGSQGHAKEKPAMPSYDAQPSASSLPADGSRDSLRAALVDIMAENNMMIPDKYKHIVEPDITEQINTDQKALNSKRKINARIERLKKAMTRKDDQWAQFRADLKDHLLKEQQRYEQEKQELQEALAQSQVDLDKMMRQENIEQDSKMEETPDPLDELITAGTKKDGKEDTAKAIPEEIRRTQADHQLLMQQMGELQQQMMYMVQAFQPPMMGSPMRAGENTPLATPTKVIGTRRHALEPFARQSRREQDGPYVKTPPKPRKVDAQLSTELALDESDIEEVLAPTTKDGYGTADTM